MIGARSETYTENSPRPVQQNKEWTVQARIPYFLALIASISTWFIAIRAPLYMDEAGSYWMVDSNLTKIWANRFFSLIFPSYFYLLWLWTKLFGTSELALRSLSLLAMFTAAWLFYLAARELFNREIALIALIIFCLHPIVVGEATEVRPYAFAILATNAAILILLRLRRNSSNWLPALFGLCAAFIVYFHYLFAVILPAFVVCYFLFKTGDRKILWRQFAVALAAFTLAFLPLIPGLRFLFRTSGTHISMPVPKFFELPWTLAPGYMAPVLLAIILIALVLAALKTSATEDTTSPQPGSSLPTLLACAALGLIPALILYGISVLTPIEVFIFRHRLVAIPGIALCWAWILARLRPSLLRPVFCLTVAVITAIGYFTTPMFRLHISTEKYALALVQKDAASDNAPVVICSTFIESDYFPMPLDTAKTSKFFPQLSYYKLTVPVVPLPVTLNDQAKLIGTEFLKKATLSHQRFFAIAFTPSHPILDWLTRQASSDFDVHNLGTLAGYIVLEFTPRTHDSSPARLVKS